MKRTHLFTAGLLSALSMPAWAAPNPNPQQHAEPIAVDVETSRGLTPEESERIRGAFKDLEELDWSILVPGPIAEAGDDRAQVKTIRGPFLGVNAKPLDIETAKALGLKRSTGLLVTFTAGNGPAGKAGLKKGDVLTKLNDQVLVNAEQFAVLVRSNKIGAAVTLHGLRDGKPIKLEAKLGEADITPLGPGGSDLQREWRVQLNPQQGPVGNPLRPELEIAPGVWIGDGWGDLQRLPANPEEMPEALRDKIKQIEQQMLDQHQQIEQKMQQHMRQICLELDLDPEKLLQQADGVTRVHRSMVKFDGEHKIAIQHKDREPHCKITDKEGKVLFDGPLPVNGVIEGLPEDVQLKLHMLMVVPQELKRDKRPDKEQRDIENVAPLGPEMVNRQALPNTLAALQLLEKDSGNIIFDPWHGADLDLAMMRDRLGLEEKALDKTFDREALIDSLEGIYAKIAGNSEMRSVLAQIEVREAIKADLGAIGKTFGDNKPARQRVNNLIQRINSDLLVQHNDEQHSIRLEGVGLLQRLTIKDRKTGEVLYAGFARTSHEFLTGKTNDPGIKELEAMPKEIKDKVKKMLVDKRIRRFLSDGC